MDDLISRSAAINVIERTRAYIGHNMERAVGVAFIEILDDVVEDIGRLPSIQFATDTNVGIKLGTNLAEVGTDLISRQAAIDAIDDIESEVADGFGFQYEKWRKHFAELPPAEPHWIPVTEGLPEEEDSIFARYYGTDRWRKSMFRKKSREVIVTSVFEDGELHTEVAHTTDGEWHVGVNVVPRTVIAWMPLPEPYKEVTE